MIMVIHPHSTTLIFFENSYEDEPYSTHSCFVHQNTSLYSTSSDLYSTPYNDQVDNTLLEFIREIFIMIIIIFIILCQSLLEEILISHNRMEEMKLEMENFKIKREIESDFHKFNF